MAMFNVFLIGSIYNIKVRFSGNRHSDFVTRFKSFCVNFLNENKILILLGVM